MQGVGSFAGFDPGILLTVLGPVKFVTVFIPDIVGILANSIALLPER